MYKVEEKYLGNRVDKVLCEVLNISRNRIQNSTILVNGKVSRVSYKVQIDDEIDCIFEDKKEIDLEAKNIPLEIVYEDQYLAIINKPYNMVVHPSESFSGVTLVNALKYNIKNLSSIDTLRPGIVHRLDKDTSGLMIIAKTNEAHEKLIDMFKNHEIEKTYLAILKGKFNKTSIRVQNYIGRDKKDRKKYSTNTTSGKLAISIFDLLEQNEKYSLVSVKILTGRTHQIRVHAKGLGYPILGDHIYGRMDNFKRQQLHAYRLEFIHPITHKKMDIKINLPCDMKNNLEKIGLDSNVRI